MNSNFIINHWRILFFHEEVIKSSTQTFKHWVISELSQKIKNLAKHIRLVFRKCFFDRINRSSPLDALSCLKPPTSYRIKILDLSKLRGLPRRHRSEPSQATHERPQVTYPGTLLDQKCILGNLIRTLKNHHLILRSNYPPKKSTFSNFKQIHLFKCT